MDQQSTPEASCGQANINLYKNSFWIDFKCHLNPSAPPWGSGNSLKSGFQSHLDSSGGHLATILDQNGVDFGPPGTVSEISRNCARTVAGARISRFRGCPKRSPKLQKTASPGNPAPRASWKAPRHDFSSILTSFWPPSSTPKSS